MTSGGSKVIPNFEARNAILVTSQLAIAARAIHLGGGPAPPLPTALGISVIIDCPPGLVARQTKPYTITAVTGGLVLLRLAGSLSDRP